MMLLAGARVPAPHDRARGCEAACRDRNGRPGYIAMSRMVVGNPDRPAALRRGSRDGNVAAERNEHTARGELGSRSGDAVCRERLRGRAEVELDPRRHANLTSVLVELDRTPVPRRLERGLDEPTLAHPHPEVRAVVACEPQ